MTGVHIAARGSLAAWMIIFGGGCGGEPKTELTISVGNGFGFHEYQLTCSPAGGAVPRPNELCALLADRADVMLFPPDHNSICIGGLFTVHLRVRGVFDGREVASPPIDLCRLNPEAERLWMSQLPPGPAPKP